MNKYVFKFDCEDEQDRSLVASFPCGVVEIEKENAKEACEWFVGYIYPMFDRMVGDNGSWRIKMISVTENGNNITKEIYDFI